MDMRKWFKEAQYGMMAHWGLYSLLGGEWNGKKSSSYAEWIQANQRIPMAEYDKLATAFNPVYFNADQWIRLAKECGMKYFVMTSKHHDGFALFHSRADRFNVVEATPFGRDVVGELAEACYKHGLKFGTMPRIWTGMRSTAAAISPAISPAPASPGATTGIFPTMRKKTLISVLKTRSAPRWRNS